MIQRNTGPSGIRAPNDHIAHIRTEYEIDDGVLGHADVLVCPENVDLAVSHNNAGFGHVLNCMRR